MQVQYDKSYHNLSVFNSEVVYPPTNPEFVRLAQHLGSLGTDQPLLHGVSGPPGGGKSTVVNSMPKIKGLEGLQVVSGDAYLDFDPARRPVMNDDWEEYDFGQMQEEVVDPWQRGQEGIYRPRDWTTGEPGEPIVISPERPLVIDCVGLFTAGRRSWFTGARVWVDYPYQLAALAGMARTTEYPDYWPIWTRTDLGYFLKHRPDQDATHTFDRMAAEIS